MSLRYPLSMLAGGLAAFGLLWLMQILISGNAVLPAGDENYPLIEFVRLQQDTEVELKNRRTPDEPKHAQPPQRPDLRLTQQIKPLTPKLAFKLDTHIPLKLQASPWLGPVATGISADHDFIPLARTPPQYPYQAARRGLEGWVRVSFRITETGAVEDVILLESEPRGVFDQAAMRAVRQWKFKPRIEDGKAVAGRAVQVVDFKLNQ